MKVFVLDTYDGTWVARNRADLEEIVLSLYQDYAYDWYCCYFYDEVIDYGITLKDIYKRAFHDVFYAEIKEVDLL